jgi:hypothetical protein
MCVSVKSAKKSDVSIVAFFGLVAQIWKKPTNYSVFVAKYSYFPPYERNCLTNERRTMAKAKMQRFALSTPVTTPLARIMS